MVWEPCAWCSWCCVGTCGVKYTLLWSYHISEVAGPPVWSVHVSHEVFGFVRAVLGSVRAALIVSCCCCCHAQFLKVNIICINLDLHVQEANNLFSCTLCGPPYMQRRHHELFRMGILSLSQTNITLYHLHLSYQISIHCWPLPLWAKAHTTLK